MKIKPCLSKSNFLLYKRRQLKSILLVKYSVALSPGLQLLTTEPKRGKFKALIGGLTESRPGFSPLPNVGTELQQIQSVVSTTKLLNQNFTCYN